MNGVHVIYLILNYLAHSVKRLKDAVQSAVASCGIMRCRMIRQVFSALGRKAPPKKELLASIQRYSRHAYGTLSLARIRLGLSSTLQAEEKSKIEDSLVRALSSVEQIIQAVKLETGARK